MLVPAIHERKSWLIFLLLVLIGINFYFNFSYKQSLEERARSIDRAFGRALLPAQFLVSSGKMLLVDSATGFKELAQAKEINQKLQAQINEQTQKLNIFEELRLENERLRALLDFKERFQYQGIAARVIGSDPGALSRTMILNRGSDHGVQEGMAVLSTHGVVGKVFQVDGGRARVLLVNDINSRVDAVVQRSRARAIAAGTLAGDLILKFLARRQNLQVGDVLISSGMDGVFPSGVIVGVVESIDKNPNLVLEEAVIRPAVDFDSVEEVFVVQQRMDN